jgi:RHO1 GDP-GTP exchange protein 1/2
MQAARCPSNLERRNTNFIDQIKNFVPRPLELHEEEEADLLFDDDARRFINLSLLSNLAVQLYDNVPRGTHVKGSVPYPRAFTGKDVLVCAIYIYSTWLVLFC